MTPETDDTARGQVGIGTLVIFIALVLVAAVAAGVLINSAGLLEQRAQETGQSATRGVSNTMEVLNVVGVVNSRNITEMNLTVRRSPGAGNIDLTKVTIAYTSDSTSETLIHSGSSASGTAFTTEDIVDDLSAGTEDVLEDDGDRYRITIDVQAIEGGNGLSEGGSIDLNLQTAGGATTNVVADAPATISDSQSSVRM